MIRMHRFREELTEYERRFRVSWWGVYAVIGRHAYVLTWHQPA